MIKYDTPSTPYSPPHPTDGFSRNRSLDYSLRILSRNGGQPGSFLFSDKKPLFFGDMKGPSVHKLPTKEILVEQDDEGSICI